MASSVAGHKKAFGSDTVPGCYEDIELAKLLVLTGSNTAWCHPILFQRMRAAKEANPDLKIVVIDPRRTATCDLADLHLPVKPGTDTQLFNGLLCWLHEKNQLDQGYINQFTEGFDAALAEARKRTGSLQEVATACRLSMHQLTAFYKLFGNTRKP